MVLLYTITHPSRIHDIKFFFSEGKDSKTELLMVAAEDKKVSIYELPKDNEGDPTIVAYLSGHSNRYASDIQLFDLF